MDKNDQNKDLSIDYDVIEAFFFAYRDFIADPDLLLKEYGFGRAHHRVLHFVHRKEGLTVAELLSILKITKQSLAKVLKQLIQSGFIKQETSFEDRRQRHLYTTEQGLELILKLSIRQTERINIALNKMNPKDRDIVLEFLKNMVDN